MDAWRALRISIRSFPSASMWSSRGSGRSRVHCSINVPRAPSRTTRSETRSASSMSCVTRTVAAPVSREQLLHVGSGNFVQCSEGSSSSNVLGCRARHRAIGVEYALPGVAKADGAIIRRLSQIGAVLDGAVCLPSAGWLATHTREGPPLSSLATLNLDTEIRSPLSSSSCRDFLIRHF
jgi:hypothetical protein